MTTNITKLQNTYNYKYNKYKYSRLALADMAEQARRNANYDLTIYNEKLKEHIELLKTIEMDDYLSMFEKFEKECGLLNIRVQRHEASK